MPPRAVICELCGGKFFKHSLAIHQKSCREKVGVRCHDCPHCGTAVPLLDMDAHIMRCPEAKAAGVRPSGASAALARRLETDRHRVAAGLPHPSEVTHERAIGGAGGEQPESFDSDDVRVECKCCGRKFAMDRVDKHTAICQKIANKRPRRPFEVQRQYCEGGSTGRVVALGCSLSRLRDLKTTKSSSSSSKSNWREQSKAFRDAMRAARQFPMPDWGGESPSRSRTGGRSTWGGSPSPSRAFHCGRNSPQGAGSTRGGGFRSPPRGGRPDGRGGPSRSQSPSRRRCLTSIEEGASQTPPAKVKPAEAEMNELKEHFKRLDTNKNGSLNFSELRELLLAGDPRMPNQQVRILFNQIDKDHNGRVDFDEFVDYIYHSHGASRQAFGQRARPAAGSATAAVRQSRTAQHSPMADRGPARSAAGIPARGAMQQWGSGASSKYGRDCMTAPMARTVQAGDPFGASDDPHSNLVSLGNTMAVTATAFRTRRPKELDLGNPMAVTATAFRTRRVGDGTYLYR